ncbi:MAG: methyl-accepting chemotaxis protein [Roseburia sp.]|nr:methyl-accepting chemotaxis protein [Roseburia sp.]
MMFGGKKQLEEEVAELREQNRKKEIVMKELRSSKAEVEEELAALTASRTRLTEHVGRISEEVSQVSELAEKSQEAAGAVHSAVMSVNNAVESFDASHSVFLGQLKNQNEKISEFLEQHRGYGDAVDCLTKVQEEMKASEEKTETVLGEMKEYSQTMGVLALNAAIEAGRMGEPALNFIHAAEEVRAFSEKYEASADILAEELKASRTRTAELEKEVEQLKTVFKECTIAVGKLYSGGVQNLSAYEAGQIDLREHLSGNTLGRADALKQAGEEFVRIQQELKKELQTVEQEMEEQKRSMDEIEAVHRDLQQAAQGV